MRDAVTEMNPRALSSYEVADAIFGEQYTGLSDGYRDPFDKTRQRVNVYDVDPTLVLDGLFSASDEEVAQEKVDTDDCHDDYEHFLWKGSEEDYRLADRYEEHLIAPDFSPVDDMTPDFGEEMSDFAARWAKARYAEEFPELFSNVSLENCPIKVEDDYDIIVPDPTQVINGSDLGYDPYEHLPLRGKCLDQDRELPGYEQEWRGDRARQPYHKGKKHVRNVEQRHIRRGRHLKQPHQGEVFEEIKHELLLGPVMDEEFINEMMDYQFDLDEAYQTGQFVRGPWDEAPRYEEFYSEALDAGYFDRLHDDYYLGDGYSGFWDGWYDYDDYLEEEESEDALKFQVLDYDFDHENEEDFDEVDQEDVPDYEYDSLVAGNAVGRRAQMPVRVRI